MYGTPNEKMWPGITKLPDFKPTFPQFKGKSINSFSKNCVHINNEVYVFGGYSVEKGLINTIEKINLNTFVVESIKC